ncbi:acyl-CoA dehydrogenase NM domain-like protein [Tilletiaria anomala UBC 951]|uniref:Acyl-CoA dehydrogenase NM domain-like protein n=1 Tax=Tilletiaria anomala (strain ATCC 24038 / CBS 436.72 / UBC 951) TaxID=1037660 RepID=A0A066WMA6_TILAU|nr:acyl-CoA dehydrogenase NM domain-like protein [Tilletiaria anomala UBC 951]KDN52134.1 acyl-CoA dehydrogenase NM domain-like protein [Tilletiaria anomala UBC 951]
MAPAPTSIAAANGANASPVKASSRIQHDPQVVQYPTFPAEPLTTPEQFYARAEQVADLLHQDEAIRDRGNVVPYRQVQLLKDAGLVTLLGPQESGGGGQTWKEGYQVIRLLARGDGSIAQIYGYHLLWFWAFALVGTDEQRKKWEQLLTARKAFLGGAVNPRDADLFVSEHPSDPTKLVFDGRKTFSTGSKISDYTILEGATKEGGHIFAAVPSKQPGIVYGDDWVDTLGMRGTQSGSIEIKKVEVPWEDALGFVNKEFQPLGPYKTLNLPTIQLVFTAFYLGITEGALARGLEYTRKNTRAWPYVPEANRVSRGTDEFYIQSDYGTLQSKVWASAALIEQVIDLGASILHSDRRSVTAEQRGEFAVRVAASKVGIVDTGLEVTSKVYELQGARSIAAKYGFDLAWRDLRTHSLHDPIAHKRAEVGRYALHGQPEGHSTPTWYT